MLKALVLRMKIDKKQAELGARRKELESLMKREAELESDIEAATTEEEQDAVEAAVGAHEDSVAAVKDAMDKLEKAIADLEKELADTEEESEPSDAEEETDTETETRKETITMDTRKKFFGMSMQERTAFFANPDVKAFMERIRTLGREKRAISGAELLIPEAMLDLIKEVSQDYSKLYKHVHAVSVPGKARQRVMGAIPEAVWTEMCATLNELSLSFSAVEVDGYKVGGYIAICNAVLEDSDIALASEIISALGQAIGYALDKAVLYGTGTKMPQGILTRLAQTTQPEGYDTSARPWENLSTTNIIATSSTGLELFQDIVTASGAASSKYSHGTLFWAMNEKTYTKLVTNAMSINSAGAIVTGQTATMPVIGGTIETLSFIPDDVIIGGYGDMYLLAERAGTSIAQSEHARFIEDQTVFKGTARYDGLPVIAEAFVAIGIGGTKPVATAVTFAEDTANAQG